MRVYLVFGKNCYRLWSTLHTIGQFFIAVNGQIMKTIKGIWSHCYLSISQRRLSKRSSPLSFPVTTFLHCVRTYEELLLQSSSAFASKSCVCVRAIDATYIPTYRSSLLFLDVSVCECVHNVCCLLACFRVSMGGYVCSHTPSLLRLYNVV